MASASLQIMSARLLSISLCRGMGNHKSVELEYLMTPSLPDTFKRDILAFCRLLHQFDEPSPTRHYIVNSFLGNSVKCGIYF
ncbi:hypothetical protein DWZ71_03890 [Bifidobacterium longum]|nr:hypothetical protein DWZ71_03890 [Bifidobacterium longum]